jgi:hypothetical protein
VEPLAGLGRSLVLVGAVLVGLGALLWLAPSIPLLGRLPGDIRIERPGGTFYLPLASCLLVSGLLSAAAWLFSKLR